MKTSKMVFIIGDVHGDFSALNEFINKYIRMNKTLRVYADICREAGGNFEVVILQCGDFAYFWPDCDNAGRIKNEISWLDSARVPLYWVGGNHENWDRLDALVPEDAAPEARIVEIDDGIFYCAFGATLEIAPDKIVLFAGGAESTDKIERLKLMAQGYSRIWWPQEGISENDLKRLRDVPRANWAISHTAPLGFSIGMKLAGFDFEGERDIASRRLLDKVLWKYWPERWFFGHYHKFMRGDYDGCLWEALSATRGDRFWDKVFLQY